MRTNENRIIGTDALSDIDIIVFFFFFFLILNTTHEYSYIAIDCQCQFQCKFSGLVSYSMQYVVK